ncbi:OprD family outer membrane porin [Pseudomonas sp. dw_358]|uniref:OprD family outer membrane porin n=1 Tax=Pseudomonas sp. dw_358 TaxID=2720083 RepID=UPI001BD52986|nr:OprD family outer membrane porin [Pseudomonas sp. dw_358]
MITTRTFCKLSTLTFLTACGVGDYAAMASAADAVQADSLSDMFSDGKVSGYVRSLYFSSHNAFYERGKNQDTVSYGGELAFHSAVYEGFSFGLSALVQRGIGHDDNPNKVDSYLGPNVTSVGEAYLQWQRDKFRITVGDQRFDAPFTGTSDYRMVPQMFQGVSAYYGDSANFLTAFRMYRFKSVLDDSYSRHTSYNPPIDSSAAGAGDEKTDGFWGVGGGKTWALKPVSFDGQAWYFKYLDYADMTYLQARAIRADGLVKPFVAVQYMHQDDDGKAILGKVDSNVYGVQLGIKVNSVTASLGYDYIKPNSDSYLNGAPVIPYGHKLSSGDFFAQPLLTSTMDLGAGNAYAINVKGAPLQNLVLGARYSFMDLKNAPTAQSLDQSEYLVYGSYSFGGALKGVKLSDFLGVQKSPIKDATFLQNRVALEYVF